MYFPGGDNELVIKATRIMIEAHAGQTRDDKTPFHFHPFRVAVQVSRDVGLFGSGLLDPFSRAEVVAAALVHDVLEDVHPDQVSDFDAHINVDLGANVGRLAWLLRNPSKDLPKGTPRPEKKFCDCAHYRAPAVPPAVRLVKLCDRADNLTDLKGWSPKRILGYADESEPLLDAITAGLWESEWCRGYGLVATQHAFRDPIDRCRRAVADARARAGSAAP